MEIYMRHRTSYKHDRRLKNPNKPERSAIEDMVLRHFTGIKDSIAQLSHTPIASIVTFLMIGITLALPLSLYLLLVNLQNITQVWNGSTKITLYLKTNLSSSQIDDLQDQLK